MQQETYYKHYRRETRAHTHTYILQITKQISTAENNEIGKNAHYQSSVNLQRFLSVKSLILSSFQV